MNKKLLERISSVSRFSLIQQKVDEKKKKVITETFIPENLQVAADVNIANNKIEICLIGRNLHNEIFEIAQKLYAISVYGVRVYQKGALTCVEGYTADINNILECYTGELKEVADDFYKDIYEIEEEETNKAHENLNME